MTKRRFLYRGEGRSSHLPLFFL